MNEIDPQLQAAIDIFIELGWDGAALEDALTLPLGTAGQQKTARAGLVSGDWLDLDRAGLSLSWEHVGPVRRDMLGAFALRLGVPARRVFEVLPPTAPAALQGEWLAATGADRFSAFLKVPRAQMRFARAIVYALAELPEVPIPPSRDFLTRWGHLAAQTMIDSRHVQPQFLIPREMVVRRFAEHLRAAMDAGIQTDSRWEKVISVGVTEGLLSRDEALELVLGALERAQRPTDRKGWTAVLLDDLGASDEYVRDHAQTIVQIVALSEDVVITRFMPQLLAIGDDDITAQVLFVGLNAKSAKAKLEVLTAAAALPRPSNETAELIGTAASPLLTHKDKKVAAAAGRLLDAWSLAVEPLVEDEPQEARGLWQPTPPLAEVPRFVSGSPDVEGVTAALSQVLATRSDSLNLDAERLLAALVPLAFHDSDAARAVLNRRLDVSIVGLAGATAWRVGEDAREAGLWTDRDESHERGATVYPITRAREVSVYARLGEVPVLLSAPTWNDFRIDPAELVARLHAHAAAGVAATEADLQLALSRTDVSLVDDEVRAAAAALTVPIMLQNRTIIERSAGDVLRDWFEAPPVHPGFDIERRPLKLEHAAALAGMPERPTARTYKIAEWPNWAEAEPHWGSAATAIVRKQPNGVVPSTVLMRGSVEGTALFDDPLAAWRAGTLLPGVASAQHMVWNSKIESIAARTRVWEQLAQEGMLSVVWPLVADVVVIAGSGTKLMSGTTEAVELLEQMLPEAHLAIESGLASPDALALPGVRVLAARTGSSAAVVAARRLTALLPEMDTPEEPTDTAMSDEEFAHAWPATGDPEISNDGAEVSITMDPFAATFTLASGDAHTYDGRWMYGLIEKGVAMAGPNVYVRFDASVSALVALEHDEGPRTPLSRTLVRTLLAMQGAPSVDDIYYFSRAIVQGYVGPTAVAQAMPDLFLLDGFDPHRIVRRMSAFPEILPGLYPVLTCAIEHASTLEGTPPRWLVRIIDVATTFAAALREASSRGLISTTWPGLAQLAATSTSPTVRRKATALIELLNLSS